MERLLKVDAALGATRLSWLRERARTNSPKSIQMMLDKHAWLVAQRVTDWDVGSLHPNRLRYLARLGRTADAQAIGRMPEQRRYPVLLASLRQSLVDITDELLDMFSQCLVETRARARRAMLAHRQAAQQARDEIVASFATIARVLTDLDVPDESVRTTIADQVPKETLARLLEACEGQARPLDTEGLDFLRGRYAYLRQFSARFLGQMRIHGNPDETPVLSAVTAIREADTESRRRLPDDATTDFIPGRWEPFVLKDPGVDRAYYQMCALWTLRAALRSGQIWVEHSRRYAPASSYVLPKVEWNAQRADTLGLLGVSGESSEGLARKAERLRTLSRSVREAADHGPLAITDGVIAVPPLDAEPRPPSLVALEKAIDRRLPQVQMSELIVEVDRWTDFTGHLTHRSNEAAPSDRTRRVLYAALLAEATNMGFTRMALATNRTFEQLAWASTWHLAEPTLQAAFGTLVDFQHAQPIVEHWGDTLSSSDGQRFPVAGKSTTARALPRYFGFGRGVTFYTAASSEYAQFGIKVIPSTARDATYVLDAILDNETELEIVEHTTDTHGYTDLVFALFDLLGLRFAPRLRDVADTRLYDLAGAKTELRATELPITRTIQSEVIAGHWDEMLRVAGSLKLDFVTASLLIGKLQAQPRRGVVRALMEYGRLCKTEHVLRYLAEEAFRKRIGTQLNKGEAIHALRRFVVFGNLSRLSKKDAGALLNQASCLNLVSNAIVVWNTVYIARVVDAVRREGLDVRNEDLRRISPVRHEHINPYGRYRFTRVPPPGRYRRLRSGSRP